MIFSSANWRTISVMSRCRSVCSLYEAVSTAIAPSSSSRETPRQAHWDSGRGSAKDIAARAAPDTRPAARRRPVVRVDLLLEETQLVSSPVQRTVVDADGPLLGAISTERVSPAT